MKKDRKQLIKKENDNKKILILIGKGKSTITKFITGEDNNSITINNVFFKEGSSYLEMFSSFKFFIFVEVCEKIDYDLIKKIVSGEYINIQRQMKPSIKEKIGGKFIFHVQDENQLKKIPLSIKRRALIYKIDF